VPTRIRLGSLEVNVITEEFLQEAGGMPDFAPHFHLSLQSGSTAVLKRMNRHYTREEYLEKCKMIYRYFPDAAITTDIIVGFPGESEADFEESLSIVREAGFAQIHAFVYSPREGTAAAKMEQLPPAIKEERKERLLRAAEACHADYCNRFLGKVLEFVPETYAEGKTYGYTENYIRVAVKGEVTAKCRVRLIEKSKDLCIGEIENG
jgi:threonylcarbamoyladenosine tRNA methylthiotransferase MtaB